MEYQKTIDNSTYQSPKITLVQLINYSFQKSPTLNLDLAETRASNTIEDASVVFKNPEILSQRFGNIPDPNGVCTTRIPSNAPSSAGLYYENNNENVNAGLCFPATPAPSPAERNSPYQETNTGLACTAITNTGIPVQGVVIRGACVFRTP